jgi:adenylosuccinate lyase
VYSQRVLLALVEAGLERDEAYRIVQEHALAALDRGTGFREALASDPRVTRLLPKEALARCFDLGWFLRNVDALYARAEAPA